MALDNLRTFITSPAMSPHHLSITTALFPEDRVSFLCPIFRNVTHLELVWFRTDRSTAKDDIKWDTLATLESLTHLSIFPAFQLKEGYSRLMGEIISLGPISLRVFIIWVYDTYYFSEGSPVFNDTVAISKGDLDMRTVPAYMGNFEVGEYGISRLHDDALEDCAGISVGKDFWTLAEDYIEARRRRKGTPQV